MNSSPKTIQELIRWYTERNLPSENVTRFFIGKDYKGAKAFGIYKDEITGNFIVYKNKADGTRSIRYEGKDEAFAVNELYKKLKDEIHNQKYNNPKNYDRYNEIYNPIKYANGRREGKRIKLGSPISFISVFMILIIFIMILIGVKTPKRGYYNYDNHYYYYQEGRWYQYDDYYWTYITVPQILKDNYSTYYESYDYRYSYNINKFEDSSYYEEPSSYSSSDYDSDYDWDSGSSWDSDFTDWDSDW